MVANHVFVLNALHGVVRLGTLQLQKFSWRLIDVGMFGTQLLHNPEIIFLRISFVEDVKLLVTQIHRSITVLATFAVVTLAK